MHLSLFKPWFWVCLIILKHYTKTEDQRQKDRLVFLVLVFIYAVYGSRVKSGDVLQKEIHYWTRNMPPPVLIHAGCLSPAEKHCREVTWTALHCRAATIFMELKVFITVLLLSGPIQCNSIRRHFTHRCPHTFRCDHNILKINMDWSSSPKEGEEKEHLSGSSKKKFIGHLSVVGIHVFPFPSIREWTAFIPASLQDQYKFVSINLIKQWRSGCLGNHWEQVAVVKIDIPVCAEAAGFPLSFTRHLSVVISLASQKSRG